jgi:hypothetical protein
MTTGAPLSPPANADLLLDRLLTTSESLLDSIRALAGEQASELLARRQQLASSLRSVLQRNGLTTEQRGKLGQAVALGDEAREALIIKRETSRRELQEKLARRQIRESFQPYRPRKAGRLNIKL